jgi:CRP/FNR family transcriptional regulator
MPRPNTATLTATLQTIPYFKHLALDLLARLAGVAIWQEYVPGALVFLEGDESSSLYIVHTGWLKVVKYAADGREQILRFIGPGEVFNEAGAFIRRPNPATAIALETTGIWLLHRETLRPLLAANPEVMLQVVENMAERIAYLAGLVAELSLHSVETRLARLLLAGATGDVVPRQRWTTQAELAARLGTVPDVLSRALRGLADAGLIRVERQQIMILDRTGLVTRADLDE